MSGTRDFKNIETRTVIKYFFPARQGAEGNSRYSERSICFVSFPVGLRTYQHLCTTFLEELSTVSVLDTDADLL